MEAKQQCQAQPHDQLRQQQQEQQSLSSSSRSISFCHPILPTCLTPFDFRICLGSRNNSEENPSNSLCGPKGLQRHSTRSIHVRLLRVVWLVSLFIGEAGIFWFYVNRCDWPENSAWDAGDEAKRARYRVAIIADPQLTDWMSYHQSGFVLALVETYTDLYMKRSYSRLHSSLRPDAVVYLGDLNDGGRLSSESVFEKDTGRFFQRVFETKWSAWNQRPIVIDPALSTAVHEAEYDQRLQPPSTATGPHYHQLTDVPLDAGERERLRHSGRSVRLYVAGNHDVGFGDTLVRPSMVRYKKLFGAVNYEVAVGNHSLIVLDTLSLSSGIQDIRQEADEFLTRMSNETPTRPRILFTHVPLFRPDATACGAERETKQLILNRRGEQYQNMVNKTLSEQILRDLRPDMIFSGDDHDWCEVAHPHYNYNNGNNSTVSFTPEVTVPTFSFAQGIHQPAFVMLSLHNPDHKAKNEYPQVPMEAGLPVTRNDSMTTLSVKRPSMDATFTYSECLLPNQLLIYVSYGALLGITLTILVVCRFQWTKRVQQRQKLPQQRFDATPRSDSTPALSSTTTYRDGQVGNEGTFPSDHSQVALWDIGEETVTKVSTHQGCKHRRGCMRSLWPLRSSLFWKMCGLDVWNIAKYAIPFYILLVAFSFL